MKSIRLNKSVQGNIFLLLVCSLTAAIGWCQTGGDYILTWSTIDGGGGMSSGGQYSLTGTTGQPSAGEMSGGQYGLLGGFMPGGPLCFVEFDDFARFADYWLESGSNLPGDLNGNGVVDLYDLKLFVYEWLCVCPYNWPLK